MGFKPSKEEQKWAKKQEFELQKLLREYFLEQKTLALEEGPNIAPLCPGDGHELEMLEIEDTGISLYKCPCCSAIWIKREEAEKLFQSSTAPGKLVKYFSHVFGIHI